MICRLRKLLIRVVDTCGNIDDNKPTLTIDVIRLIILKINYGLLS